MSIGIACMSKGHRWQGHRIRTCKTAALLRSGMIVDTSSPKGSCRATLVGYDILRYSRASKETGIGKGEYARVIAVDAQENALTVLRANGGQTTYDPRRQMGVSV